VFTEPGAVQSPVYPAFRGAAKPPNCVAFWAVVSAVGYPNAEALRLPHFSTPRGKGAEIVLAADRNRNGVEVAPPRTSLYVERSEVAVSPILWSTQTDPPDGLAATPESIIVVGCETIAAFDRASGTAIWSIGMSDTSGPTPVVVTPEGIIVVAPPYEAVQAFDVATGETRSVPDGVHLPAVLAADLLPDGYTFDAAGIAYHGKVVWHEQTSRCPAVARLGDLAVINDFNHGLRVVDDLGSVRAAPELGPRECDGSPILITDDVAVVVTSDSVLYAIRETDP
jgi:hypothetical protein